MSEYTLVQALSLKMAIHFQLQNTEAEQVQVTTKLLDKFRAMLDSAQESK